MQPGDIVSAKRWKTAHSLLHHDHVLTVADDESMSSLRDDEIALCLATVSDLTMFDDSAMDGSKEPYWALCCHGGELWWFAIHMLMYHS